jgi:hypothetical protein
LKAGIITIALLMFGPFSQSLARKHDPSDVSRLVDLRPMPRFKDMNRGIPGLGSYVLGDGDMKIGGRDFPQMSKRGTSERLKSARRAVLAATSSENR